MKRVYRWMSLFTVVMFLSISTVSAVFALEGQTGVVVGWSPGATIYGTVEGKSENVWGGTIRLKLADDSTVPTFCTDLYHHVGSGDAFVASDESIDCRIKWLIQHYPPRLLGELPDGAPGSLSDNNKEIAARQAAVWHFSDNYMPDRGNTIGDRAWAIIDQAPDEACVADDSNIDISPAGVVNLIGSAQTFTVTVTRGEQPVESARVQLAVSAGTLSPSDGVLWTDAAGQATFVLSSDVAGIIQIEASANLTLYAGTIFVGVDANKQKLVLGKETEGLIFAESTATWQENGAIVAVSFVDKNMNGVFDEGESLLGPSPNYRRIALYRDGIAVSTPTDTDSNGQVHFDGLSDGNYSISQAPVSGWYATTSLSQDVTVNDDVHIVYFGQVMTPVIIGQKFEDSNANGFWDKDELPLSGWELQLFRENGSAVIGMKGYTDEEGKVVFSSERTPSDIPPGDYYVQEVLPEDSGWYATTGISKSVTVGEGEVVEVPIGNVQLKSVRPILECVVGNHDGTYTAFFGYKNENAFPVTILVGAENKFSPLPADRGQPTTFVPGRTPYWPNAAFSVDFDGSNLVWTLDGRTSTASSASQPCSYHIFLDKEWYDADGNLLSGPPDNLPEDFTITAESELGTAVCSYPEDATELECVYTNNSPALDNKGLWVPAGSDYTVDESGMPAGWEEGSGLGIFVSGDPKGYCQPGLDGLEKNCLHLVTNYKVSNQPPVAVDDEAETPKNTPVNVVVLVNDSDPDGDPLTVIDTSEPAHGSVVVNANGTVTYTPDDGFSGEDSFTYTISDGNGGTDTATVTVTVVNQPPVAVDDEAETPKNTPVNVVVLVNDSDPDGDPLTVIDTSEPAHGGVVVNANGTVTYTPDAGFSGEDSFTYTISDGDGGTDTATVTVTVVNQPPVAVDDSAMTYKDKPVGVVVLDNDSDPDGDPLTVIDTSEPAHGSVMVNANGTVTYTPDAGFSGEDSFTYTISDGDGGTDTATVTVMVIAPFIVIEKSVTTGGVIYSGDTVTFLIWVKNSGNVPLTNVTVIDALAPGCAADLGTLTVGQEKNYTCEQSNVTESFTNIAMVEGTDPLEGKVQAHDSADVDVVSIRPEIVINKSVANEDVIYTGDTVTFFILVENTGDVPLSNVMVTDLLAPACSQSIAIDPLPVGESDGYYCQLENVTASFTNEASVQGTDPAGGTVTATDTADVNVIPFNPSIVITKSLAAREGPIFSGDNVEFRIEVKNTGDVELVNVEVTDEEVPDCDSMIGVLSVGSDSVTYFCVMENVAESFTNEATVVGTDPLGGTVEDTDSVDVEVQSVDDPLPPDEESGIDTDGDGIPDILDDDSDNDGIPDDEEGDADNDGDGIPNYLDDDTDGDGIPDEVEGVVDTDGDGIPNYLDEDADGDGIPDEVEGVTDADGDGIPNYLDEDSDGDDIPDEVEGVVDTDGDGIPNYLDEDSDGDGIPDEVEGVTDADGDGIPNYLDEDADGDGIPDEVEGVTDVDGDGIPNYLDEDADGDGIPDEVEGVVDADGDGIPNYLDEDSDDDGIPDAVEGAGDADGDGIPDYLDLDSDDDGIPDAEEGTEDRDGDGIPNYLDLDSDGDGIPDAVENTDDADGDGLPDPDADGDGIPNYLDLDSDGDGRPDADEGTGDRDGDGIPNYLDPETISHTELPYRNFFPFISAP